MVPTLIKLIDEIVKFGTHPNLAIANKEANLENNLVKLYAMSFDVAYIFDENYYPEFGRNTLSLRETIASNFPHWGYYKELLDIDISTKADDIGTGDAIDDLHDIIIDLQEVKWRLQNNSEADGLWYFSFAFRTHIKQHLLSLLKYMHQAGHKV